MVNVVGVLVICERGAERFVLEEIKDMGSFDGTGFREVLIGEVEDLEDFLTTLEDKPFIHVSRVIPYEESFHFKPETLVEILKEKMKKYADRIGVGETFCVRMERRGLKGRLSSKEVEREVGGYLWNLLKEEGKEPKVDLEKPDKTVVIQTLGNLCLLGLVNKEFKQKHFLVRFK
jgi:tRNA(Ser,Leu) C12 N-acetylase TAN1